MTVGITELPPEGMQLPGVALAGDADRGTKTTEGISLLFTTAGITVQGPQPQIERLLVWTALDSATCHEVVQLTDGREAAIMELTSGGQSIRFLLPADAVSPGQAAYLDQALPTWLARYKGSSVPTTPVPAAAGTEVGVTLPAPGPTAATTQAAPSFAAAGVAAAGAAGAGLAPPPPANGNGPAPSDAASPGMAPTSRLAPPPPAAPTPTPPPPAPPVTGPASAPPFTPAPPAPPAPTVRPAAPPAPTAMPAQPGGGPAMAPPPPPTSAWDDPPLAASEAASPVEPKAPWYKLAPRKPKSSSNGANGANGAAAGATTAVAADRRVNGDAPATPAPAAPVAAVTTDFVGPPPAAKTPWYKLSPRKPKAAGAVAGAAVIGGVAATADTTSPPAPATAVAPPPPSSVAAQSPAVAPPPPSSVAAQSPAVAPPPPSAPPTEPVPLAVQPPAPGSYAPPPPGPYAPATPGATGTPGDLFAGGPGGPPPVGASAVVLADGTARPNRRARLALIGALVLVLAGAAGYVVSTRMHSSTPTAPAPVSPSASATADTALAGSINLRLADLPTGWSVAPPAQAVVRPPVAPAGVQADATNVMASCLNTSYADVSGLFDSGALPNQTSLVQSPLFQSAAGPAMEMGSKTMTLASPAQVQALDGLFTNPKFDACYQQYLGTLAAGAVPGATAQVQPVSLTAPTGVQAYGVVTTYTLPGSGAEVVGDAFMLGGRVVSVLQPSTNGPAIPGNVFSPAYDAVVGRVAAAAHR